MRNCFVQGCDLYCKQKKIVNRMMFLPPRSIVEKWSEVVKNTKRPLNKNDRICERHFGESDIIQYWESNINGQIHLTPRDKPKLRDQAIPSRNLSIIKEPPKIFNSSSTQDNKNTSISSLKIIEKKPNKRKLVELEVGNKKSTTNEISDTFDTHLNSAVIAFPLKGAKDGKHLEEKNESTNKSFTKESKEFELDAESLSKNLSVFESLYEEAFDVELPSLLWGIHRDPLKKFLAFTEFSFNQLNASKILYISETLAYKIMVNGILKTSDFLSSAPSSQSVIEQVSAVLDNLEKASLE